MEANEFKRIFLPHHRLLYRLAFQLTGDAVSGEDLLQDFYLKLWQQRDSLPLEARTADYLAVMMRNMHLNLQRGNRDKLPDEMGENYISANNTPELQVESEEQMLILRRLIERLPPKEAEVARLMIVEQRNYDEIQSATGMEYGAVRIAAMRVRKKLLEQIKKINDYERHRPEGA